MMNISQLLCDMEQAFLETDDEGRIVEVSPSAARMLKIDSEKYIGSDISGLFGNIYELISSPPTENGADTYIYNGRMSFKCPDSGVKFFNAIILRGRGKSDKSVIVVIKDMLSERLIRFDPGSIKKLMSIGVFAGGIAHDYNNALTVILGNLSLAKLEADNNPDLMESINDAESAAVKIKELTERLSVYSKGLKPEREKTGLSELVNEVISHSSESSGVKISFSTDDDHLCFEVDRGQMELVFGLIIENAIEACDSSLPEITIRAGKVQVEKERKFKEISLSAGEHIFIEFLDNGRGLQGVDVNAMFDPFVTTKENHDGLGLALVFAIIKRHKGFVELLPGEDGGALVKIFLPLF